MPDPVDVDLEAVSPAEAERLRKLGVQLPRVSDAAANPTTHSDYIDRRLTAVGFGIYLGGYHLYCTGMDLPVMLPEGYVDFQLAVSTPVSSAIFPDRAAADGAISAFDWRPPMAEPIAYYRSAGGLIVPTIFSPATTPRAIATMASARRLLAESVQQDLVILALSIVGGMILRTVFARMIRVGEGKNPPLLRPTPPRIKPVNGTVNVGGGLEAEARAGCTNLNPINPNSGGPSSGIANHVRAGFEEIGDVFETGSVNRVFSRRLRYVDVKWDAAARGAARVMAKNGTLEINVWTSSQEEVNAVIGAFKQAGFRNVTGNGYVGPGTIVTGTFP